ncbi:MAG: Nif3-like dinuclear metal center hexameric protein [Oscillospiraceae bacterium]|nr:Nif3-like dinuclear metal center hexameric protein [Oscillospiraceae bacterium]
MISVSQVYRLLQSKAPFELQAGFDNAGFLVGRSDSQVSRILVALDITEPVIQEAIDKGAQLIVSHHPVIFGGIKSLTDATLTGRKLLLMAEHGISGICAHTNLDAVEGGVNDALALKLGLSDIGQLRQEGTDQEGRPYGIGRVGTVPEQSLYDFALSVKALLGANGVRLVDGGRTVRTVAVGGGSCGDFLSDAVRQGCDTFVTSDVKYDKFLEAKAIGINLIDAGHYPTENVVCPVLQDWLQEAFPNVETSISRCHKEVFSYL